MRKGQKVGALTNKQLLFDHMLLHKWYRMESVQGWSKEDIMNDHVRIVMEIIKRGLEHPAINDELDDDSEPFYASEADSTPALQLIRELPDEVVLHDEFVKLVGSFIEELKEPNDIDVLVTYDIPAVREVLNSVVVPYPLHITESSSSTGQSVPVYELVLRKRSAYQKYIYDYKIPLGEPTPKQKYMEREDFIIEPEFGYFVEPKLEGEHVFIHKDGYEVYVFGDAQISESALEILSISGPEQYIVEAIVNSEGEVGIIDMLRHSTTEITDFTLKSRKLFLDKFDLPANPFVFKVPSFYVDAWEHPIDAMMAASTIGTTDIILKDDYDMYYLDGREPNWCIKCIRLAQTITPSRQDWSPLKAKSGYGKYEFNDPKEAWAEWGMDAGTMAVEKKFDGFRCVIHKLADDSVKIFTEDKRRDIAQNFPRTVEMLQSKYKGKEFVIDSELVRYDEDDKTMPRQQVAYFIHGKQAKTQDGWRIDDKNAIFHVFDCLYVDGKSLADEPWTVRNAALRKLIPDSTPQIKIVDAILVDTEGEFVDAIRTKTAIEGSEGAMMKYVDSTYSLTGRTAEWAKFKAVYKIDLEIMRVIKKKAAPAQIGRSQTFMYDVGYLRDGKVVKMGTTYSTNEQGKIGEIITITPAQITYNEKSDTLTFMFPRVYGLNEERTKPDTFEELKKLAQ